MKYLRCHLIYAGLCLLLICSANMASAQPPTVSVSGNQALVSRTIDFTVNLSRQLGEGEAVEVRIRLVDVVQSEVKSINPLGKDDTNQCGAVGGGFRFRRFTNTPPPQYSLCMDEGEQKVTIRLVLEDTFDASKAIAISLFGGSYFAPGTSGNLGVSSTLDILPPLEVGLERETTTQTSMGLRIDFNFNSNRQLMTNQLILCTLEFRNVSVREVTSVLPEREYSISTCRARTALTRSDPLRYNVCMDAGEQNETIQLQFMPFFDATKIIAIAFNACADENLQSVEWDPQKSVLRYPDTAIFIRSKVFLEGPLQ